MDVFIHYTKVSHVAVSATLLGEIPGLPVSDAHGGGGHK